MSNLWQQAWVWHVAGVSNPNFAKLKASHFSLVLFQLEPEHYLVGNALEVAARAKAAKDNGLRIGVWADHRNENPVQYADRLELQANKLSAAGVAPEVVVFDTEAGYQRWQEPDITNCTDLANRARANFGSTFPLGFTPECHQDINRSPFKLNNFRPIDQCYDGNLLPLDVPWGISLTHNTYTLSWIKPAVPSAGHSAVTIPSLLKAGTKGFSVFRSDYFTDADFANYAKIIGPVANRTAPNIAAFYG